MKGTRFYTALLLGLDLRGTLVLLLVPLNLLPFFPLLFSTFPLPPKYSLEQGLKTRAVFLVNVPVPKLRSCSCVSDPVNICVQSRKSWRGRLERPHPTALSGESSEARVRPFSPGPRWGESESPHSFSEGDERCRSPCCGPF